MKRIQNVKVLMDTSYTSLSKYDMEELGAYQVFIYLNVYGQDITMNTLSYTRTPTGSWQIK